MSERIERAAVRLVVQDDCGYPKARGLLMVFDVPRPLRHDSAIHAACAALRLERLGEHEQGFVTSTGRFVDRTEGGVLALLAGQTNRVLVSLMSEDVW